MADASEQPRKKVRYPDLIVWQKAMDFVVLCYRLSERFPRNEEYGLKAQLRHAAVSVPANIAEGHERTGIGEYLHHLSIALGSLAEAETHLRIAVKLGYLAQDDINEGLQLSEEIGRMLNALINKLHGIDGSGRQAARRL